VGALDTYNARTRRLLTDGDKQFWSDVVLNDAINSARRRIAGDTKCLRQLVTNITLPEGQEVYNIIDTVNGGTPTGLFTDPMIPIGPYVIEVIGVTVYWGNMRIRLQNRPYTEQDAKLRIFQSYVSRPGSIAMMGANQIYFNPVPDHDYTSDWDVVVVPPPLERDTDREPLPVVFQECVPYFAAHLAKYNEQSLTESNIFYEKYNTERTAAMYAFFGWRVRDAYRR
jgi:hypothetical protein